MPQKRVALLCDLSCAGGCSASVALPVLNAAGLECAFLPTMLLSTHTGFENPVRQPQAAFMADTAAHWRALGLAFDAILVGYLGGEAALAAALDFTERFKTGDTLLVVDPAMADGGRLYGGYAPDYPEKLAALAARADVLLPNATEAALLLGEGPLSTEKAALDAALGRLCALGAKSAAITGLWLSKDEISVAARDKNGVFHTKNPRAPGKLFGTGDLFSAALTAALVRGRDFRRAVGVAGDFCALCAQRTAASDAGARTGVRFEDSLGDFMAMLGRDA